MPVTRVRQVLKQMPQNRQGRHTLTKKFEFYMTIVETLLLPARTPCMWDVSLRAHDSTTGRRGVCTTLQARATSPSTVSEFYSNGLVVSDVLCSSTLHSYEDPLWTSMHQPPSSLLSNQYESISLTGQNPPASNFPVLMLGLANKLRIQSPL